MKKTPLIQELEDVLARELPTIYKSYLHEFRSEMAQNRLRGAYAVLYEVTHKGDWHPSPRLQGLVERFWIEIAQ
jgi:hypothetical protein